MTGLTITGVTLTRSAQCNVLETAINAGYTYGIGYWTKDIVVKEAAIRGSATFRIVMLQITDEDGMVHKVGGSSIEQAVRAMLMNPEATNTTDWAGRLLMDDDIDGPVADAIVQVACFGKVTYA